MAGDSRVPPLSRRVPGATKRSTPEILISAPVLPSDLLERLRAEMGDAQARAEPAGQLAAEQSEQPAPAPLRVSGSDDGPARRGRSKRRGLRDSRLKRLPDLTDVSQQIPASLRAARAEAPPAKTVNGRQLRPTADAMDPPQQAADRPRAPTPADLAKMAAALVAPTPHIEDITQPIPVILEPGRAALPAAETARAKPASSPADAADLPRRHATRRPLAPTPADLAKLAASLGPAAPHIEDTQPIPVILATTTAHDMAAAAPITAPKPDLPAAAPRPGLAAADTLNVPKQGLAAADTLNGSKPDLAAPAPVTAPRPDLAAADTVKVPKQDLAATAPATVVLPPAKTRKAADRKRQNAPQTRAARRRRQGLRRPAVPQMSQGQMLRPLFAEADRTSLEEVVASVRVQSDGRRAQAGRYRMAGVFVSVLVITIVMVLVVVR
ncbi:MAG: hypothetical protein ACLQFR_24855 [Streptosporangiaceae bacterium]